MSTSSFDRRVAAARRRKPDTLDQVVSGVVLFVLLIVLPIVIGAFKTPYLDGKPAMLNASIRAEQRFVADARAALVVMSQTHELLIAQKAASAPTEAYQGAQTMQAQVERVETLAGNWQRTTPPGRFAGLHRRFNDALKAYQQLATESWAYYGDFNAAHLEKIAQALPQGDKERHELESLLNQMDFVLSAPKTISHAVVALPVEPTATPSKFKFGQ